MRYLITLIILLASISCNPFRVDKEKQKSIMRDNNIDVKELGNYDSTGYLILRTFKVKVDSIEYVVVTKGEAIAIVRHSKP